MAARGKFIAIEGIDGSGKRTQLDLLANSLEGRGVAIARFSFPRYGSSFGKLVAAYLNGEFGSLASVDAHFSALLYAGDRFEAKKDLEGALGSGQTIVADRYIGSNLAHQTARVAPQRREEFMAWLARLEYEIYGLPKEDLVLYMRLPVTEAQRLVAMKPPREYTAQQRDLQEADTTHLEQAALVYDRLALEPNWVTIECAQASADNDSGARRLRDPEAIHQDVLSAIHTRLPELLPAMKGRA